MYTRSVPVYDRFLGALSGVLKKAEDHCTAKGIAPEALLTFRLYPDMFTLTRQVQLACDFAARGVDRLRGLEPRSFPDTETSFAELQARIQAARDHINGATPAQFEGAEARVIEMKMRNGTLTLPAEQFLDGYSIPQFHFHLTTAYAILRHNGVELGKRDYMGA